MPPSPQQENRTPAPDAILDAAEALLLEGGSEGFSIRRLSQRCGYSAPTIYHHFGDKTGLIDAIVEARFSTLLTRLKQVPHGHDPADYLHRLADAFMRFGLENPRHYHMLSHPRPDGNASLPSAEAARELVADAFEQLARKGRLATDDLDAAFQVGWAVMHGLISLKITRPDFAWSDKLIEVALQMIEDGLLRGEESTR